LATVTSVICAKQVGVRFDTTEALAEIDLEVARGAFVSIVGPSGCGKSTLLRAIAGLSPVASGSLEVAGKSPQQARRSGLREAFVFQDPTLLPWRTVAENTALVLELRGTAEASRAAGVMHAITSVGLDEFADAYPDQLSGGMRMRASLARALVTDPELLLLDEPFGALDELTRQRLHLDLRRLWHGVGFTALAVTHNVFEAVFLAQRVVVLSPRPGRIVADIPVDLPGERSLDLLTEPPFLKIVAEVSRALRDCEDPVC